jgi:hypothetical protein
LFLFLGGFLRRFLFLFLGVLSFHGSSLAPPTIKIKCQERHAIC